MPTTTDDMYHELGERIRSLRYDGRGMKWREVGAKVGMTAEQARGVYRRIYGDGTPKKHVMAETPLHELDGQPEWSDEQLESVQGLNVDEWFTFLESVKEKHEELDPVTTRAKRVIRTTKPVAVQFVSCWHLGSRFVEYREFKSHLDRVNSIDRFYWGLHGDELDNFPADFKSAEATFSQLIPPKFQRELVRAIVEELGRKRKALYACWSNHPGFDEARLGENLIKKLYQTNNIPYLDGKGVVEFVVGGETYLLYVAHKFPGSSLYSRNAPQAKAMTFDFPSADVVVQGHRHQVGIQKVYHHTMEFDMGKRPTLYTWLIETGAAKSGNDPYSIRGWSRGLFEWPTLVFYPDRHEIKLVDNIDDLEYFLGE